MRHKREISDSEVRYMMKYFATDDEQEVREYLESGNKELATVSAE